MMKEKLTWMVTLLFVALQFSFAQEKTVSGTVKDASGIGLPGVAVLVKGEQVGTQTDFDGNYSLKVATGKSLVFTYLGMKTVERVVGSSSTVNVTMEEDALMLDDVVVTGTGVATSKRKVAIAVQSVDASELPTVPSSSIDQALTGKIAGAQITSTSGQPGQQASILLRGINSLGTTQPMILVDGVQINAGSNNNGSDNNLSSRFADLDLSNVERVEVIQGAAAGTIYGAQGANGVIQIFTKKGKKGEKVRVTLNSQVALNSVLEGNMTKAKNHYFDTDASGYIVDASGSRIAPDENGLWAQPSSPTLNGTVLNNKPFKEQTYNHFSQMFKKNVLTNTNAINVSGGAEMFDAALNISRMEQESIINGSYKRHNVNLNVGLELFKNFTIRSNSQLIVSTNTTGGITGQNNIGGSVASATLYRQYWDMKFQTPQGYYVSDPDDGNSVNPFYYYQFRNYNADVTRLVQSFDVNYKISKFFELNYKFGYDTYRYDLETFTKYQLMHPNPSGGLNPNNGRISYDNDKEVLQNSLLTAFIRTDFEEDFGWNIPIQTTTQLAYDFRKRDYKNIYTEASGFAPFPPYNLNTASEKHNSENNTEFVTFGYLINQKIDFGSLFGISGGVRVDYSSAFGAGSEAFVFPRGDVYFRLDEVFKKDFLSEFKLRAAYGEAGIQPGAYDRFVVLTASNVGNSGVLYMPSTARNPNLGVQVSKETEFGVDLGILNKGDVFNTIRLSGTYWKRKSEDVIRSLDVAPSTGTAAILDNALTFSSSGIEVSLNANVLRKENFVWDMGVRFGKSETIVDEISNGKDIVIGGSGDGQFVIREGESLGAFFGKKPLSSLDELDASGNPYIASADRGNYEIVNGMVVNKTSKGVMFTADQHPIGDPNPDFTLSFDSNFNIYKNLTVRFQLDAVVGNDIYNNTRQFMYRDLVHGDLDKTITVDGQTGAFVNYYNSLYLTNETNAYFVEDGSFLRLRDLSIAYNFAPMMDGLFKNFTISLSGRNLWTLTNYSGFDPEAAAGMNSAINRGLDLNAFPNPRTYQVGLSLEF